MSQIVISYSRDHFDPLNGKISAGTGKLAFDLWNALIIAFPNDEIIYLDYTEYATLSGSQSVKLFIGVSPNFEKFIKILKPTRSILWAVNASAKERRKIVKKAKPYGIKRKAFSSEDGIFSNVLETYFCDQVIVLGSWENFSSYTRCGLSPEQVFPIGSGYTPDVQELSISEGQDILFFVGNLTVRKGVHLIEPLLQLLQNYKNTKLKVVGKTTSLFWERELDSLLKQFPNKLEYFSDWIEFNSDRWAKIIAESKFGIFPTFEEGVAAAAIDLIHQGLPLIYSVHTGLEITKSSTPLDMLSTSAWLKEIEKFLNSDLSFLNEVLMEQKALVKFTGTDSDQIQRLIRRISKEQLWPNARLSNGRVLSNDSLDKNSLDYTFYATNYKDYPLKDELFTLNVIGKLILTEIDLVRLSIIFMDKYSCLQDVLIINESLPTLKLVISKVVTDSETIYRGSELDNSFKSAKIFVGDKEGRIKRYPISLVKFYEYLRTAFIYKFFLRKKSFVQWASSQIRVKITYRRD